MEGVRCDFEFGLDAYVMVWINELLMVRVVARVVVRVMVRVMVAICYGGAWLQVLLCI